MSELLGNILHADDIKKAIATRSKTHIEQTISHSTPEALDKHLELEKAEGWVLLRKNAKSYRLKKVKPNDEQLEDELWCLLARMGFEELSDGRQFKISASNQSEPRQIDVFAKDEECALFVECTQCETPKRKNMSQLIQKIAAITGPVRQSVVAHYGRDEPLKMRWIIATRNIEWGEADLKKAIEAKIVVLRDQEIGYFNKLTAHIKTAARYQLLSHVFSGETVKGLQNRVFATRGKMGGRVFYNFLMHPTQLLKLAYVSHKASRDVDDIETYQRMLKPSRLKAIARYVDEGGQFPTNIVVNIKTKNKRNLSFDKLKDVGGVAIGALALPSIYSCAWVIDGQHRLYGYAHSDRSNKNDDKTTFPVLAYENLPPKEEAQMFVDINCEQVKVQKNLLMEIYSTLNWGSNDRGEKIEAIYAKLALALDRSPSSPIYNRVITSANQKLKLRCLTIASFTEGLRENKFFGILTRSGDFSPGPFWASYVNEDKVYDETLSKAKQLVSGYLDFFASNAPNHWSLGDGKGGFLSTNLGLRTLLLILKNIIAHCEKEKAIQFHSMKADDILKRIVEFTQPISSFFETAPQEKIMAFRHHSSKAGVKKNAIGIMFYINKDIPGFTPDGLQEYIDSRDEEGTKEARQLVADIQKRMAEFVIHELKKHYGDEGDVWWYDGVKETTRQNCVTMREQKKGKGRPESYLFLISYREIALDNWANIFQGSFSYTKEGNKEKKTQWIVDLNDIRNTTMHPERGTLTKEQVEFVRKIDQYTKDNFKNH